MTSPVNVRPGRPGDIESMQQIEIAAGSLFAEIGMHDVAEDGAHEAELLAEYVADARAWVAEQDGVVCGYALIDILDCPGASGAGHGASAVRPPRHRRGDHRPRRRVGTWAGVHSDDAADVPRCGLERAVLPATRIRGRS